MTEYDDDYENPVGEVLDPATISDLREILNTGNIVAWLTAPTSAVKAVLRAIF